MNKIFTFSALLLSGALIGSIAGRFTSSESLKFKRGNNVSKNIKSVKNFIKKTDDEEINQYFI